MFSKPVSTVVKALSRRCSVNVNQNEITVMDHLRIPYSWKSVKFVAKFVAKFVGLLPNLSIILSVCCQTNYLKTVN